ncbi:Gastricsin [Ceratocystis platani]|uniref:Gastricsin n=1 Tax=Ceratocystis fimbriata f. sp. platani TaxID=88771 RepID=A0A0F8B272_CERFI|nr:Gastricsin [Ceratocystis platani]
MHHSLSSILAASAMVGVGSAAVLNLPIIRDDGYNLVDVQIGSPPTTHRLRFDTGSATTWVVDQVCGNGGCAIHSSSQRPYSPYDASASTSHVATGVYSEIQYLGGKTTGFTYHDNFDVDGTVWQQSFMAANSSSWTQMPADGFLGLAFSTIADGQTTTLVETLLWDGKLDKPRFGIFYNDMGNLNSNNGGVLTIGDSCESTYGKDVVATIPTQLSGGELQLWRVDVYAMTGTYKGWVSNAVAEGSNVNTDPIPVPVSQRLPLVAGSYTVFDTGGSAASVPTSMLVPLYRSINMDWESIKSGAHIPLCSEFTSDWHVEFEFANGQNVTIYGDQLALPGFANRDDACWPPFDDSGANEQFFLFGPRFLRNFYTTFDFGSDKPENYAPTVSFAPLKDEYKSKFV